LIPIDAAVHPTLYSTSQTIRGLATFGLFVPLVAMNRKWSAPAYSNAATAVDEIADLPLSQWKVLRFEQLGDQKVALVELTRGGRGMVLPCKRHSGTLTLTPTWLAWFSLEPTYFPLKVERSSWFEWQGKRYELDTSKGTTPMRFKAGDLTDYGSGLWFPKSGSQETYRPDPKDPPFDVDELVDDLLKEGKGIWRTSLVPSTHREWQVLKLQPIDPKTSLWFDPPKGTCVLTMETNARRIEGLSEEESRKLLKISPDQKYVKAGDRAPDFQVTTLEGKTHRLKDLGGKFVLLDFWSTSCPPCVAGIPRIREIHEQFKDDKRIVLISLSMDDDKETLKTFLEVKEIWWPQVLLGWKSDLLLQYGVLGVPSAVLIGPDGRILRNGQEGRAITKEELLAVIASQK
jgi:peroxiredoxin